MEGDASVFAMGEDIGRYGGIFGATGGLLERFGPERVMDTPISESAFIGAAVVAEELGPAHLRAPIKRLGVPGVPIPYSRPLERAVIPQVEHIAAALRSLVRP
jgi:pyruvate/2-oxoglutarate/acetoin dehydrogenase E1 component